MDLRETDIQQRKIFAQIELYSSDFEIFKCTEVIIMTWNDSQNSTVDIYHNKHLPHVLRVTVCDVTL